MTLRRRSGGVRLRLHVSPVGVARTDFGARRVAALLAEGRSVRDMAAQTGSREGYVRWLLKQAYKKNDLSGQVALVRLVLAADSLPKR